MNAISPVEIDPRPCGQCGLTIDRHEMVDDGEGPEFFCRDLDGLTLSELELRAELVRQICVAEMVRQWELDDERDRWRHTGERKPIERNEPPRRKAYAPPQCTVDAFWYLVRLDDAKQLEAWLGCHPKDAAILLQLLEGRP